MAVCGDQHEIAKMTGNRTYEHFDILAFFFGDTLTDTVVINNDALRLSFGLLRLILP